MNITVYEGSAMGTDPAFREAAERLGTWIAEHGHTLVYGGGNAGLMGVLADAALAAGGKVIGMMPRFLVDKEVAHQGLTEFYMTETMSQRKMMMIERGDAFIAMPGGTGTLEEIAEVLSLRMLHQMQAPCIFLNVNGFYDDLKAMFDKMTETGFVTRWNREMIVFVDVDKIGDYL